MSSESTTVHGIRSTAGIVTTAAGVMPAVFATFATLSEVSTNKTGIGLAAAGRRRRLWAPESVSVPSVRAGGEAASRIDVITTAAMACGWVPAAAALRSPSLPRPRGWPRECRRSATTGGARRPSIHTSWSARSTHPDHNSLEAGVSDGDAYSSALCVCAAAFATSLITTAQ